MTGDSKKNIEALKEIATEWNKLGDVPTKNKKDLYEQYSKALNSQYDQIDIDDSEKEIIKFKNKLQRMIQSNDTVSLLEKEKRYIDNRVKITNDSIVQYETNLGFFAKSGKADFLKVEAEKKLEKSKEELALLERKQSITLSYLNHNKSISK